MAFSQSVNFPYNATYPWGMSNAAASPSAANTSITDHWNTWKTNRLTDQGIAPAPSGTALRVKWSDDSTTISEGMGYGMLLAVYMNDQTTFDKLYAYVKAHLNEKGLMYWHVGTDGNWTGTNGNINATDGDEDCIMGLYAASIKWGQSSRYKYMAEARPYLQALLTHNVEPLNGKYYLVSTDGSTQTGQGLVNNCTDPSYFAPSWYRCFQKIDGKATEWNSVIATSKEIMNAVAARQAEKGVTTGLMPNWCQMDGTARNITKPGYFYGYDAFRVAWRQAVDYSWNGDAVSRGYAKKIAQFYANTVGNLTQVYGSRELDGTLRSGANYQESTFLSAVASGMLHLEDPSKPNAARDYYNALAARNDSTNYFASSWQLLGELYVTGNLPNPDSWNRAANPSFETFTGTAPRVPSGWSRSGSTGASYCDTYSAAWKGNVYLTNHSSGPYNVTTSQTCNNLSAGTYTLRAWVRTSSPAPVAKLVATTGGGTVYNYTLPTNGNWTLATVSNISIPANGSCTVSIQAQDTVGGKWIQVDDVVLIRN